ncbi:hypothetical protein D6779_04435 [Candidatus Parcubacteria bacterium]|nr:MAG: hypothetical protein D6779_04435 [Candidatus Parcubacteria bacterium]
MEIGKLSLLAPLGDLQNPSIIYDKSKDGWIATVEVRSGDDWIRIPITNRQGDVRVYKRLESAIKALSKLDFSGASLNWSTLEEDTHNA